MTHNKRSIVCVIVGLFLLGVVQSSNAGDWPTWRYDAGRTGTCPDPLPKDLHVQWVRHLPPAEPAWPASQFKLQFDVVYEPVVSGGKLFVPSNVTDSVTAYNTKTGEEIWRFYAEAPVRFAPTAGDGKVWFCSDDGYVYCLNAEDGSPAWKFRGGPTGRKVIGNDRLGSTWPVRGAPVMVDGVIYFAAGIWPFMGIFYYALDAQTGEVIWTNSGSGTNWTEQPHGGAVSFSYLVPQGYFSSTDRYLVIPGGRSTPGVIDAKSGKILHFVWDQKGGGGPTFASGSYYYNAGLMHSVEDGRIIEDVKPSILTDEAVICFEKNTLTLFGTSPQTAKVEKTDRKGEKTIVKEVSLPVLWKVECPDLPGALFIRAGNQYYFGGPGSVACAEATEKDTLNVLWRAEIDGAPGTMAAAGDSLFVVTLEGSIYCFGPEKVEPKEYACINIRTESSKQAERWRPEIKKMLNEQSAIGGYCLVLGAGNGETAERLSMHTSMPVIVLEPNPKVAEKFRRKWTDEGIYGKLLSVVQGDVVSSDLPPYLAGLIVSGDVGTSGINDPSFVKRVFEALHPYGGLACFGHKNPGFPQDFEDTVKNADPANCALSKNEDAVFVRREGSLPGSADWTHQYADSANSLVSKDTLVKLPLGVLWYGGPSNDKILPRHGHGPAPQVAGGRLFIEGEDVLRAVDVYTGRLLWEKDLPKLGWYYRHTEHHPGANEIGSNYVSLEDSVYVVYGDTILRLDPTTGETVKEFKIEGPENQSQNWGYIGVWEDLLIAGSCPVSVSIPSKENRGDGAKTEGSTEANQALPLEKIPGVAVNDRYASAGKQLIVMDRHTGNVLWTRTADYTFRHNAVVESKGKLFCIDGMSPQQLDYLKRMGLDVQNNPTLYALDIRTGNVVWKTQLDVFGTWLSCSEEFDVLVQGGSPCRDRAIDEADKGMVVHRADNGEPIWKNLDLKYGGPLILHHDTIITNGQEGWGMKLLTGEPTDWKWRRTYGCNTAIAGEYLMTFRSGAAGFYDLLGDSGTGNLGGFKSGCTSNLIPANGVLNAPDYTRTCDCAYQNQSSLALIHTPEEEMWTFDGSRKPGTLGINFNAPGNRRGPDGTLWLDFPNEGGDKESLPVTLEPREPEEFRFHSSYVTAGDLPWVASSGFRGLQRVIVTAGAPVLPKGLYTLRLVFSEPEDVGPGERVFDVWCQGDRLIENLDIVKLAAGTRRTLIKEFPDIQVVNDLSLRFEAKIGGERAVVLCGMELIRRNND